MLKLWKFSPLCRQNQSLTWLGAVFYNGHFTWLDNSYVNYLNWAPGQPDVHEWGECIGLGQNLHDWAGQPGAWDDVDCWDVQVLWWSFKQVLLWKNFPHTILIVTCIKISFTIKLLLEYSYFYLYSYSNLSVNIKEAKTFTFWFVA